MSDEILNRTNNFIVSILGDLLWDVFIPANEVFIPAPDSAVHLGIKAPFGLYPGGTTNLAAALHFVGVQKNQIHLIATVGNDHAGHSLVAEATQYCVVHATPLNEVATGFVICHLHENGERGMLVAPGASAMIQPHHVPIGVLQKSNLFIGSGFYLINDHKRTTLQRALRTITENCMLAFDPGAATIVEKNRNLIEELLATRIDIFLPNRNEFCTLMNCQEVSKSEIYKFFEQFPRVQVLSITLGNDGAITTTRDSETPMKIPAHELTAVDTTGAGDAYAGAFLGTLITKNDPIAATKMGIEVSSLCIQHVGGHEYKKWDKNRLEDA